MCQIKSVVIWKTNNIVVYFWVVSHRDEHQKENSLFSLKLSCKRLKVITQVKFNRRRIKRNVNKVWKMFSWNDSPGPPCTHAIPVSYRLHQTYFQSAIQSVFSICCCVLSSIGRVKTISVKEWQGSINRWLEAASLLQNTSISIALNMIYQETSLIYVLMLWFTSNCKHTYKQTNDEGWNAP